MRGRWLIIGLIASVALNLFLIGAGGGRGRPGHAHGASERRGARPGVLVRATRNLPQPDRRNMRQMLRQAWLEVRPATEQSRALKLDAWRAIADPKADVTTIKAKLAQSRQLDIADRAKAEEELVDYALTLPPADRQIFANGMLRVLTPPARHGPAAGPAKCGPPSSLGGRKRRPRAS